MGTIMEVYKNEVLVMTVDFELVRVKRKPEMYLGQQVYFGDSEVIKAQRKSSFFIASAMAAIMMFAIIIIYVVLQNGNFRNGNFKNDNNFYAYVDLDINPSIEFLINDNDIVKKVIPLNNDGKKAVSDLLLKEIPIKEAVEKVIGKFQKEGVKNTKNNIVMISASLNPEIKSYKENKDNAELKLNKLIALLKSIDGTEMDMEYTVKVVKVEPEVKKQAVENGLSTGRQLILKEAQNNGVDMTLNEAKTGNLAVLMKKVDLYKQSADKETFSTPILSTPSIKSIKNTTPEAKPTITKGAELVGSTPKNSYDPRNLKNDKETSAKIDIPTQLNNIPTQLNTPPKLNTPQKLYTSKLNTPKLNTPTPKNISESKKPVESKKPDSSAGTIKIQYYNISKKVSKVIQINTVINVINTGSEAIDLKDLTLRYYYTINGERPQSADCWAETDKSNIIHRFIKMDKPSGKADYYHEIGFKSGLLEPGKSTMVITWFNKDNWSNYEQDDDHSYNSSSIEELYDWKYVTGYIKGALKWGIEP